MENISSTVNLDCNGKVAQIRVVEEQVVVKSILKSSCNCNSNWEKETEADEEEVEDDDDDDWEEEGDVANKDEVMANEVAAKSTDDDILSSNNSVVGETKSPTRSERVGNETTPTPHEPYLASFGPQPPNSNLIIIKEGELFVDLRHMTRPSERVSQAQLMVVEPNDRVAIQDQNEDNDSAQLMAVESNGPARKEIETYKDSWSIVPYVRQSHVGPITTEPGQDQIRVPLSRAEKGKAVRSIGLMSEKAEERKMDSIIQAMDKAKKPGKPGRRKAKKTGGAIFRAAAAAISLSMSANGVQKKRKMYLNEAEASWKIGKIMGLHHEGSEEEVVSKIKVLEEQDDVRFTKGIAGQT